MRQMEYLLFKMYLFIFVVARWFSLVAMSGGDSLVAVLGLLTAASSLAEDHGLEVCGLQ